IATHSRLEGLDIRFIHDCIVRASRVCIRSHTLSLDVAKMSRSRPAPRELEVHQTNLHRDPPCRDAGLPATEANCDVAPAETRGPLEYAMRTAASAAHLGQHSGEESLMAVLRRTWPRPEPFVTRRIGFRSAACHGVPRRCGHTRG